MKTGTLNRFEWLKAVNRSDLLARAKVTAAALAIEFCNDETGRLNPGLDTLADATGQSKESVKRAIRDLAKGGWLARIPGKWRGDKTQYTLLSPGKVIAISSVRTAAPMPPKKGGTDAPSHPEKAVTKHCDKGVTADPLPSISASERGSPVPQKGVRRDPSYNIAKQTMNKGARPAWDGFRNHRFRGNATDGPRLLFKDNDVHQLDGLSDWLADRGLPPLCQLPISEVAGKKRTLFALPYRDAPTDPARCSEAYDYFTTLMDAGALAYAAQ